MTNPETVDGAALKQSVSAHLKHLDTQIAKLRLLSGRMCELLGNNDAEDCLTRISADTKKLHKLLKRL